MERSAIEGRLRLSNGAMCLGSAGFDLTKEIGWVKDNAQARHGVLVRVDDSTRGSVSHDARPVDCDLSYRRKNENSSRGIATSR